MADNFPLTPGAGRKAATDDVTYSGESADVQLVRFVLVTGAEGAKSVVEIADAANGLDVDVTRVPAPLSTTGGGTEATALRVTLASDSTGIVSIDDNGGSITVDGSVGLAAGTNNIGDVDVLTVPAPLSTTGGGTQATALRVTLASDSTGVVAVTDNGGSITVDGALTVSNAAGGSAVNIQDGGNSITVDGSVTANLAAGTNNIGDVDVLTVPADPFGANADAASATGSISAKLRFIASTGIPITGTVTVGSHAVTNAGTFQTQESGAALTALQLIDNLVLAEDAIHNTGDPGVQVFAVRNDADAALAASGDYTPLQVDANGYLKVNIKAGAGSGGTAATDDAAFTPAATSYTPIGGIVTADSVDSGDGGAFAMLANRQQKVTLYDSGGSEVSVGGGTQYAEDTNSATGQQLTMAGVTRADTAASQVDVDGDRTTLIVDSTGKLHVNVGNTVTVASHDVTNAGTFAVQADTELPTAAALADNTANPTVPGVGSYLMAFDGTNWDRVQTGAAASGSLKVDGSAVTQPVSGTVTANLATGTNNIGDVDVLTIAAGDNNIGNVDIVTVPADPFGLNADAASATGSISAKLRFIASTGIPVTNTVTVASHAVTNAGTFAVQVDGTALTALQLIDDPVFTDDAVFTVATSKVNMAGALAVAHGSNPDAAESGDAVAMLANRHRVQFVIGGHPNTITRSVRIADADGAQTDASIAGTISAGTKVVVTAITVTCDAGNTNPVAVKIGFGATTIPADSTTGANGVLLDHEGIAAGSGVSVGNGGGILGVGADGEELRLTCEDPVGGFVTVTFSYYTIES